MNKLELAWKEPFYIFHDEHFTELMEIFKEGVGDVKGHFGFGRPHYQFLDLNFSVYEDDALNDLTKEELEAHYEQMIEESGNEFYGEVVRGEFSTHISFEVGNDDYLHLISIKLLEKGKGVGTRMVAWLEEYAKSQGFKGVLIRSTESEVMNHLAVKRGYVPVYNTVEERIAFGKQQGFRYDPNAVIKYDSKGHIFGYYQLTF